MENEFYIAHKLAHKIINLSKNHHVLKGVYVASRYEFLSKYPTFDINSLDANDNVVSELLNDYSAYKVIAMSLHECYDELANLSKNGLQIFINICNKTDANFKMIDVKPVEIIGEILLYKFYGKKAKHEIEKYLHSIETLNGNSNLSYKLNTLKNLSVLEKKLSQIDLDANATLKLFDPENFESIKRLSAIFNCYSNSKKLTLKNFASFIQGDVNISSDYLNRFFIYPSQLNNLLSEKDYNQKIKN